MSYGEMEKLRTEVRELAQSHNWPKLRLMSPGSCMFGFFMLGLCVGVLILFLLTRGDTEGFGILISGGGGGVGLIIMGVTIIIGIVLGFKVSRKETYGEQEWTTWISQVAAKEMLLRAKSLLDTLPK